MGKYANIYAAYEHNGVKHVTNTDDNDADFPIPVVQLANGQISKAHRTNQCILAFILMLNIIVIMLWVVYVLSGILKC